MQGTPIACFIVIQIAVYWSSLARTSIQHLSFEICHLNYDMLRHRLKSVAYRNMH